MRILVVDDDPELLELLAAALQRDTHHVVAAASLREARDVLDAQIDVVVLDLGLPDGSGLDLCREVRAAGNPVPILLLTAQSAVSERVRGLDAGADDYLAKPFALAELRARVRALGRRQVAAPLLELEIGEARLNLTGRRAYRGAMDVELTSREWQIVDCLARRQGRVVNTYTVLDEVWEDTSDAARASLEVLIGRIRRKLGRTTIRTVRGEGYALG